MDVKKGDRVTFLMHTEVHDPGTSIGIVKFRRGNWVELLCEGEHLDYTASIDNIKEIHGNVFSEWDD